MAQPIVLICLFSLFLQGCARPTSEGTHSVPSSAETGDNDAGVCEPPPAGKVIQLSGIPFDPGLDCFGNSVNLSTMGLCAVLPPPPNAHGATPTCVVGPNGTGYVVNRPTDATLRGLGWNALDEATVSCYEEISALGGFDLFGCPPCPGVVRDCSSQ